MDNKNIIIIAFKFPPMGGIGTRRWAKFAKYLALNGYNIHIITIDFEDIDTINWLHDVIDKPNIHIHRTKTPYPNWLLKNNKKKGIKKKISEIFIEYYKRTSNWLDVAQGWEKFLIPKAKELITKHKIKNIIVTASPVSALHAASFIKVDNPETNLILDYRDPWNDDIYFETISKMSFKKKQRSLEMEMTALKLADHIFHVSQDITRRYQSVFKNQSSKITTLHNGYDSNDYEYTFSNNSKFDMVYVGSLSPERSQVVQFIIDAIKDSKDNQIKSTLNIHFYGASDRYLTDHKDICTFHRPVNPKEISQILNKHTFCLSVNIPEMPYAFGTKVFDYMAMNKPIFHISNQGELSHLLTQNQQYVTDYNTINIQKVFLRMKTDYENKKYFKADYSEFDIKNLTRKIESFLI